MIMSLAVKTIRIVLTTASLCFVIGLVANEALGLRLTRAIYLAAWLAAALVTVAGERLSAAGMEKEGRKG
jgi:hypothetical protein